MVSILEKMRAKLDGLEMVIKSESQKDHPKVLKNIEIEYILKGENLNEADVKKAIELSLNKYCSVGATLAKCAEISYRWKIING
jgi:putative redox protein